MADSPVNNGAQNDAAPALNALAQYTKDFSFENPNAPRSLQPQQQGPQINLQVNVGAKQLSEAEFEVDLTLEGDAKVGELGHEHFQKGRPSRVAGDRTSTPAFVRSHLAVGWIGYVLGGRPPRWTFADERSSSPPLPT